MRCQHGQIEIIFHEVWLMESNHGNLCCQCVSGQHLEKCLPLLGLLMVYDRIECWGEWASPSFPHTFCDAAHTFSLLNFTHTWKHKHCAHKVMFRAMGHWLCVLETVANVHEEVCHSGQVFTCPPVDKELKSFQSRLESRYLYPCFSFYPLPLTSVPLPSSLSRNKHFKTLPLCCTHARSHPSDLLVIEKVFRQDHWEIVSYSLLFFFVLHRWGFW